MVVFAVNWDNDEFGAGGGPQEFRSKCNKLGFCDSGRCAQVLRLESNWGLTVRAAARRFRQEPRPSWVMQK
jgi:hypothetical protein